MAIFKEVTPPFTNKVVDGLLYILTPGKTHVVQQANNNRSNHRSKLQRAVKAKNATETTGATVSSASFQNLDDRITGLDGQYDHLSNQAVWELYAGNIAGDWDLCANCQPGYEGKKLYRQYNFNRGLIGLPDAVLPSDVHEFCQGHSIDVQWILDPVNNIDVMIPAEDLSSLDFWTVTRQGGGLSNPLVHMNHEPYRPYTAGDDVYDFCASVYLRQNGGPPAIGVSSAVTASCVCASSGAPGHQVNVTVLVEKDS